MRSGYDNWYQSHEPVSTVGSNSKKMFAESTLAELVERNNANRKVPMDGMSGIVVNVKQLQRWCEDCMCSIDCQCNSCVYGCVRSVDCHCCFCLDVCSREMNEGDNQAQVVSDDHVRAERLKVENGSKIAAAYNEDQVFDEYPQRVKYEVLVEPHSIQNTNTMEIEIVNLHLNSRLYIPSVEDTIPKLMGLNNLSSAYNVTTHLESAPSSKSIEVLLFKHTRHKLDMELGDKLFDLKMERDIFAAFRGPHTTIGSLPHALGLYICYWVDTRKVFWACLDRLKSDAEAKLQPPVAMKSEDWDENASALIENEGAEVSEPRDKSSEGVCLTEKCNEWTDGIIVEAWENTTKIVSIEATLEQLENMKQENVDVEASSRYLTPLQLQKMAEMKVIMSTMKIEIIGSGMLEIEIFKRMKTGILDLTVAISLSFDPGGTTFYSSEISFVLHCYGLHDKEILDGTMFCVGGELKKEIQLVPENSTTALLLVNTTNIGDVGSLTGRFLLAGVVVATGTIIIEGGVLIGLEERSYFMKEFCCLRDSRETLMFPHQVIIELNKEVHSSQHKMDDPTEIASKERRQAFIWDTYCQSFLPQDITKNNQLLHAILENIFLQFPFDPGDSKSAILKWSPKFRIFEYNP